MQQSHWNPQQQLQQPIQNIQQQQQQPPMDPQKREDAAAVSFLAMAEHFRSSNPPLYKAAAKCLFAATKTNATLVIKAHVHFQLGKLIYNYTKNITRGKMELETAHKMFKELGTNFEEKRLQCACMVAECALSLQDAPSESILPLLQAEAQFTRKHPKIHAKALMLTIEALAPVNPTLALEVSEMGQRYFKDLKERVMECYFQLVKSLLYARMPGKEEQLGNSVTELGILLNQIQHVPNINDMRAFCYTIQLSYFLSVGMISHSKRCLRELQLIVQNKGQEDENANQQPGFQWLRKELLTGLTYVLTSLWSIQSGQFDKAERYYENSMLHFGELNATMRKPAKWGVVERRHERLIAHLHFALHDGIAQMYLIKAKPEKVFDMTNQMYRALRVVPKDLKLFEGQLHFIMGLYLQSINVEDEAAEQYKAVVSTTDDYNLTILSKLSLCMLYLSKGKEKEFYEHFESVRVEKLQAASMTVQTLSRFVFALHSFIHGRIPECKANVVESVQKCQERDILRGQAIGMLLISRVFDCRDTESVIAGRSWASKTNDLNLQAWANRMVLGKHF
jgi:MAternally-affected-uncoordination protein